MEFQRMPQIRELASTCVSRNRLQGDLGEKYFKLMPIAGNAPVQSLPWRPFWLLIWWGCVCLLKFVSNDLQRGSQPLGPLCAWPGRWLSETSWSPRGFLIHTWSPSPVSTSATHSWVWACDLCLMWMRDPSVAMLWGQNAGWPPQKRVAYDAWGNTCSGIIMESILGTSHCFSPSCILWLWRGWELSIEFWVSKCPGPSEENLWEHPWKQLLHSKNK